jgi:hypothetical protein
MKLYQSYFWTWVRRNARSGNMRSMTEYLSSENRQAPKTCDIFAWTFKNDSNMCRCCGKKDQSRRAQEFISTGYNHADRRMISNLYRFGTYPSLAYSFGIYPSCDTNLQHHVQRLQEWSRRGENIMKRFQGSAFSKPWAFSVFVLNKNTRISRETSSNSRALLEMWRIWMGE